MQLVDEQIVNNGNTQNKIQTYTSSDPITGTKTVVKTTSSYATSDKNGVGHRGAPMVSTNSPSSTPMKSSQPLNVATTPDWSKLSAFWRNNLFSQTIPEQMRVKFPQVQFQ